MLSRSTVDVDTVTAALAEKTDHWGENDGYVKGFRLQVRR